MSIYLIESERRTNKSLRGALVSIALHALVITFAVYATAHAGEITERHPPEILVKIYPPQPEKAARKQGSNSRRTSEHQKSSTPTFPVERRLNFQLEIIDSLPPIDSAMSATPVESLFRSDGSGTDSRGSSATSGSDSGAPMTAAQVDKPAMARDGNPIPKYPSVLESSRIEGSVLVQFVVDTMGRADMATFSVLQSSNELFAQSLHDALPKWRFYPAEAGGRRVKQLVQLPLKFVAPRR